MFVFNQAKCLSAHNIDCICIQKQKRIILHVTFVEFIVDNDVVVVAAAAVVAAVVLLLLLLLL